jgi:hypothetical protein
MEQYQTQTVNEWKEKLAPVLQSKAEEFQLMGYPQANSEEIWDCLMQKVWTGNPKKRLYEVVAEVFQLKTNIYLSYLTHHTQVNEDLSASISAVMEQSRSEN